MMLWVTIGMALHAMTRNKMRSFLTMLGVVIGVAAVIAMVHIGEGATRSVRDQIASLGQNLLMVRPGAGARGPGGARVTGEPFDLEDAEAIAEQVPNVEVAPTLNSGVLAVYGHDNWPTTVTGTTNAFFEVRDWEVAEGRRFDPAELRTGAPVCILGATVHDELLPGQEAIGATLRLGRVSCRVVGVLESKQSMMGADPDDVVLMPIRTVQRRLAGTQEVQMLYVSALVEGTTQQAQASLEALLRERRRIGPGDPDDFQVRDMEEIAKRVEGTTGTMTMLLGAVAAVSLLVGGIGIMNIMLVSVTERTREIGIRLAVGARGREVLLQFLVEAAMLSTLGGVVGIGLGLGGSWLASSKMGLPFAVVPEIVVTAFLFSAGVGVLFGFVPARKASRLNPIEALRHE
ncbi:MAG: ABC transporter permease [Myxococcota bacterium]